MHSLRDIVLLLHCCSLLFYRAILYVFFIIPVRIGGAIHQWPYAFLDMSSPACAIWYTMLFLVNNLFFVVWYQLSALVSRHLHSKQVETNDVGGRTNAGSGEQRITSTIFSMSATQLNQSETDDDDIIPVLHSSGGGGGGGEVGVDIELQVPHSHLHEKNEHDNRGN